MTLADFTTAVRYRTEMAGDVAVETHPTAGAGLPGHLSASLKQFCAWTYCLRGSVSTTLGSGASTLDVGALAPRVIHPLQVAVGGTILTNYAGKRGPCRIEELVAVATGSGDPTKWAWKTEEVIQFNEAPSASKTVVLFGFIEHPAVSADGDAILLPSEWQEAAADYAAVRLVQPVADGSMVAKLEMLNTGLAADMQRLCRAIQAEFPSLSIPYLREMNNGSQ